VDAEALFGKLRHPWERSQLGGEALDKRPFDEQAAQLRALAIGEPARPTQPPLQSFQVPLASHAISWLRYYRE
jgi:hypothetical protein